MFTGVIGIFVDGVVIGRGLGVDAMASYSFTLSLTAMISGIANAFSSGTAVLCGKRIATGDKNTSNQIFSQCIIFAMLAAFGLLLIGIIGASGLSVILGAKNGLEEETANYIRGFVLGTPAQLLLTILIPIMQLDGDRNRVLKSVGVMTFVNIVLDIIIGFILHKGLFFMALATSISYYAGAIVLLLHFKKENIMFRFSFILPKWKIIKNMFSYGFPEALQQISRSFLIVCMNYIIFSLGNSTAVSAFSAVYSASLLCMILGTGIGDSILVINSLLIGEKDVHSMKNLLMTSLKTAIISCAVLSAVIFAISHFLMKVFLDSDIAAQQIATWGFRAYSFSIVLYAINVVWRTYYQSMHIVKIAYPYVILNNFVFIFLLAMVLGKFFGLEGVWFAYLAGEALTLSVFTLLNMISARKQGFLDRMMHLDENFTNNIISSCAWSCSDLSDIEKVSMAIGDFCKKEGASQRIALVMSLATEEIGVNIYKYGFTDNQHHSIDIKIQHLKDGWILRFRDDCFLFDPTNYVQLRDNEDPMSHIGLRMISKLTSKMEYVNAMKLNNLLIKIIE